MRSTARHDALDRRRRQVTRLGSIIEDRDITYAALAGRARLQPRTVRMLATGETPLDNVAVGTIRRIASALAVPLAELLEEDPVYPGDVSRTRTERLSAAIREVMWPHGAVRYPSPVEAGGRDEIADLTPGEFFDGMPAIDARRG
jgi:transcriptional regulator with XRE-family HTH domain